MKSEIELKNHILQYIHVGSNINSDGSSYRFVEEITMEYLLIPKGEKSKMKITWAMLHICYKYLFEKTGYNKDVFRQFFPEKDKNAGCHVTTIGQIFINSNLATHQKKGNLNIYTAIK